MHRIVKIALVALGVLSAGLWYMLPGSEVPPSEAIQSGAMSGMFSVMWLLLAIATVSSLIFGVSKMLTAPGGMTKVVKTLVAALVLTGIGYGLASGEQEVVDAVSSERGLETTVGTVKTIGTLLNVFFGMVVIAIVLMIVPGVKKVLGR